MKFLLTKELGRLAKWMRILGWDTAYFKGENAGALVIEALRDSRIIITRNQHLPKSGGLKIINIQKEKIREQIPEVLGALKIKPDPDRMFSRCIICNEGLTPIHKDEVQEKVPVYVFKTQEHFITCPKCQRIYWPGTHWGNARRCLQEIEGNA